MGKVREAKEFQNLIQYKKERNLDINKARDVNKTMNA